MTTLKERFDEKWIPVTESGCWIWTGCCDKRGYGDIWTGKGRSRLAHRVSWELHNGPIPKGEHYGTICVCHRCDTPSCVNPLHLFLGTHQENIIDMFKKGRGHKANGEKNNYSKLSDADVIAIRADGRVQDEIAADYGVHQTTVSKILLRKSWSHL